MVVNKCIQHFWNEMWPLPVFTVIIQQALFILLYVWTKTVWGTLSPQQKTHNTMTITNRSVNRAWLSDIKPLRFCFVCYTDVPYTQLRQCDVDTLPRAEFSPWTNTSYLSWLWWKWGEIMHEGHLSVPLEDLIRGLSCGRRLAQVQTSSQTEREATVHGGINGFQMATGKKVKERTQTTLIDALNGIVEGMALRLIEYRIPPLGCIYIMCVWLWWTVTYSWAWQHKKQISKIQSERQVISFFIIEIDFSSNSYTWCSW